jgi:predicted secreted protein
MVYQALKEKHPINHIILSDTREHMKEKVHMRAIENTTDYYSFAHKKVMITLM